jgi:hypothetical protein
MPHQSPVAARGNSDAIPWISVHQRQGALLVRLLRLLLAKARFHANERHKASDDTQSH